MRKLRIAMRQCKNCDKGDDCPVLKEFTDLIVAALQEIYELWGLH